MSPPKPHVAHLVKLLTYVTQRNAQIYDDSVTVFHASEEEDEPLIDFIGRLDTNIRCSEACYATALVYVDRITEASSDLTLNAWTVQRLFSTSLLIANQFLDDTAERTLQFARVTGLHPMTMANLKTEFLFRVQFQLHVTVDEIHGYADKLQGRFSSAEFQRLGHWDGTPRADMVLQLSAQRKKLPQPQPRPRSLPHSITKPVLSQRNVVLVAKTGSENRQPVDNRKRIRHQHSVSQGALKHPDVVGGLAAMAIESLVG